MHYLLAAIVFLAPHIGKPVAKNYARIIKTEAARKDIDPLLVVSFIHVETFRKWNPRTKSTTNDYGLCQVHVAERGSARFLGREEELYIPKVNIREWTRLAAMWRNYHHTKEDPAEAQGHMWWAHLKWGYKVKNPGHAMKVTKLYTLLKKKFRPELENERVAQLEEVR